ncbi:hypothetical protein SAMN05421736_11593 [Evansella caseinilytica]|uniref:Uncharacterized protein n=1 Tax=Evansella caseinilytica TaxID=1503961 RepID=A0A1H3TN95_9BACI|nr:hypothetical protein [Evansella caseinilytica]SDZ51477.1 hypothetical protein SAMN05421736_11593 [Evansella caseinilytica]
MKCENDGITEQIDGMKCENDGKKLHFGGIPDQNDRKKSKTGGIPDQSIGVFRICSASIMMVVSLFMY